MIPEMAAVRGNVRRRLDAATARRLILDAAEKRLVEGGPAGIRLQEVAADAGVSHPTVLHHFGSREGLVKAVCSRSMKALHEGLVEAIGRSAGEKEDLTEMLESVYGALTASGHARVMMWLALEGERLEGAEVGLDAVVDATHALRKAKHVRKRVPPRDDTAHAVVLAALALVGAAVFGAPLLENAGLAGSDAARGAHFRAWLGRLLGDHLDEGG